MSARYETGRRRERLLLSAAVLFSVALQSTPSFEYVHAEACGNQVLAWNNDASEVLSITGPIENRELRLDSTDEAATKLIWLALRNITAKWARTSHYWRPAMNQFAILYEGRFAPSTA